MREKTCLALLTLGVLALTSVATAQKVDDPYFSSRGAWKQKYDDQWGLKRVGFTRPGKGKSAWDIEDGARRPVIVAVIDSGLDFYHPDIRPQNIWYNPDEFENGIDDDGNGYIDDVYGWDFVDHDNRPWDRGGHGTATAGIIAAATGNGEGIAGINRGVRIMVLRVLNAAVSGTSVPVAAAIHYAVEKGARVINLSLGGRGLSRLEHDAVKLAHQKQVVVVAAAGNEGIDVSGVGPAALDGLITVASTDVNDQRIDFSNWGRRIDISAPGIEILTLRARFTDVVLAARDLEYQPGSRFVGPNARYYRVSGTSFSAPFVAGVASLMISREPKLSAPQVTRMILQSARDIDTPGVDQFTGYGLLDAVAALKADPEFFVTAQIEGVSVVQKDDAPHVRVTGSADADRFDRAWIEIGAGENPKKWKKVSRNIKEPVRNGTLDDLEAKHFGGAKQWTLRVISRHKNGRQRENRFLLKLG